VLVACSGVGHVFRGYETASEELALALHDAISMTLVRGGGPWLAGNGFRLPCVQRFGPTAGLLGLTGGRSYLVEQRSFAPGVYALARLAGFDVVHLHDPGLMNVIWHARRRFGGRFAIVFTNGGGLSPEHLRRPDLIQCVTPVDAARLRQEGFSDARIAVLPHGTRRVEPPERAFTGAHPGNLIGVGTLNDSNKGFATAIRAAAEIPGVTLRLLGQRDEETPGIEALGRERLGARFSTATLLPEQVPAALAKADAFVLPTHSEGFCLAVLEAMGSGLPCVVSDIPVLRWLVGEAGLLLPPDRPHEWAAAISALTAERRREMSERGRRRAAEFWWQRLVPDHLAMYEKAMRARPQGA
jgi:glycosyltransferase involved in cell wall biosynthesis